MATDIIQLIRSFIQHTCKQATLVIIIYSFSIHWKILWEFKLHITDVIIVDWGLGASGGNVIANAYNAGVAVARFLDNLYNAGLLNYNDVTLV